jgi:hypothetical protein
VVGVGSELIEAVLLVLVMVVLCRWAFGTRGVRRVNPRPDYGMLAVALRSDTEASAENARRRLAAAGIRATVAPAGAGFTANGRPWPSDAHVVLVFPPDLPAAEQLLHPTTSR